MEGTSSHPAPVWPERQLTHMRVDRCGSAGGRGATGMSDDGFDLEILSANVRLFRLAHGLSVEDVARRAHFDVAHVVAIEDGTALPTMVQLERLSIVLNVDPDRLLFRGPVM